MNPTILARIIGQTFRAPDDGKGGAGGTGATAPDAAAVTAARTYLADFVDAEPLKAMKDEDVVKQHTRYTAAFDKHTKAGAEKTKAEAIEKAKGIKLELPKDSLLTQPEIDKIAATARERGLSLEQANELVASQNEAVKAHVARQVESSTKQREEWVKTVQNDPDLGGAKLTVTQRNSQRAIDTFLDADVRKFLRESGFGDHPGLVRALAKIGAAMSEDGRVGGDPGSGGKKTAEQVLYGSSSS